MLEIMFSRTRALLTCEYSSCFIPVAAWSRYVEQLTATGDAERITIQGRSGYVVVTLAASRYVAAMLSAWSRYVTPNHPV